MKISEVDTLPPQVKSGSPIPQKLSDEQMMLLQRDCKQILYLYSQYPDTYFYHGSHNFKTHTVDNFTRNSPEVRLPSDTPLGWHNLAVKYMQEMGLVAHRGNSTYITTSLQEAGSYGKYIFAIFPCDGFHFTWSPLINDFYNDEVMSLLTVQNSLSSAKEFAKETGYRSTDLKGAFLSGYEVMITGKYYRIPLLYPRSGPNRFLKDEDLDMRHFLEQWIGSLF